MKRSYLLIGIVCLLVPFVFWGCSGNDGATGASGATGPPGPPGSGVVAQETCDLCHGNSVQVNEAHRLSATGQKLTAGSATVTINQVTFPAPTNGYVKVKVDFTFQAFDSAGNNITSKIDLRTASGNSLSYATFALAKLEAGTNGGSNEWSGFVADPNATGSGPFRTIRKNGYLGAVFTGDNTTGVYSYTFGDNTIRLSDGYVDNVVMRATVQVSALPVDLFTSDTILQDNTNKAVANAFLDVVNPVGGGVGVPPTAAYPTKNNVTTAACNQCHDPIGAHSQGARRETTYCVVCHNPKSEIEGNYGYSGWDNVSLINLVHGIHREVDIGEINPTERVDGVEVKRFATYPQDIRNCTTCHKGTDDFWKTRPTRYNCNSCHDVDFATGAGHGPGNIGGPRANDSACAICHAPEAIVFYHAAQNETPGNVPPYLDNIVYFIDNVTVDNNVPVVGFRITKNGAPMTLTTWPPTDYDNTSGPTFLVAYTMSQDGITTPADYNNLGKTAGQPASVSLRDLSSKLTGGPSGYTAKLTSAPFPAGAKMRAVALQSYFTQLPKYDVNGDGVINSLDNVGRHTPAVMKPVNGDTERRAVVDSGKCLSCHKVLELHGGSRVNNVQVCVMCHNPNLSSSGRSASAGTKPVWGAGPKEGESAIPPLSTDPLTWPERTNNLKELVHGIHASEMRGTTNPYQFVRVRNGTAYYFDWSEVTYPAQLRNCTKCHVNPKSTAVPNYEAVLPAGVLLTTEETTNGNNTQAGITAARTTVPNSFDIVNTPTTSGCGFCHDDAKARSHMVLQGGKIKTVRGTALEEPNPLAPAVPGP